MNIPELQSGDEDRLMGARIRVPILVGPLHTVDGDDLPPLDASDPRFGTGIRELVIPVRSVTA